VIEEKERNVGSCYHQDPIALGLVAATYPLTSFLQYMLSCGDKYFNKGTKNNLLYRSSLMRQYPVAHLVSLTASTLSTGSSHVMRYCISRNPSIFIFFYHLYGSYCFCYLLYTRFFQHLNTHIN